MERTELLPPLNALRTFDVAARHESASRAAEELHVTHGAVSRQIRQLEDALGTRLFDRAGRGLTLTQAGRELATATRHHLGGLARVCGALARSDARAPFVLSCPGSFLARWFIPRLGALKDALPELELHLTASDDNEGLRNGVDGVLRFQTPPFDDAEHQETRVLGHRAHRARPAARQRVAERGIQSPFPRGSAGPAPAAYPITPASLARLVLTPGTIQ